MRKIELLIVILLTIGHALITELNITGSLRVISGLIFLSFLPGYVLLSAITVEKFETNGLLMHSVTSIPISLALICVFGLATNYFGFGLDTTTNLTCLSIFILFFAFVSYYRHPSYGLRDRNLSGNILAVGSMVILLTINLPVFNTRESPEITHLSLYVVDSKSLADDYPRWVKTGYPEVVLVGVEYRGNSDQRFTLVPSHNSTVDISLSPGETWKRRYQIRLDQPGTHKLTWRLYQEGKTEVQREISIWLNAY